MPALAAAAVRLLPMTDDRVETHVAIADPEAPSGRRVVHFQEYWVRLRAEVPAETVRRRRPRRRPRPAPGVLDAITDADLVVLPPSNPVVSVGTILGVPRRPRGAGRDHAAPVVGLSPIVGGTHVRGMAEQMLDLDRRRGERRRRSACTTARAPTAACSTAGWSTRSTPARSPAVEAGRARRAAPYP